MSNHSGPLGMRRLFWCLASVLLPLSASAQGPARAGPISSCLNQNDPSLPLPSRTIFQFGPGNDATFLENIASRSNGDILITMAVPQSNIFALQNPMSSCPTMVPVFQVPGSNGTHGIAEIATKPDVFAVIAGNISLSGNPANGVLGSNSVWELDLRTSGSAVAAAPNKQGINPDPSCPPALPLEVTARKIAHMPMAPRLNGLAAVPGTSAVLVGDSQLGVAFRLDTATGAVTTAVNVPEMKPVPGAGSADDALGLNGIKVRGGALYFTTAASRTVYRIAIQPDGSGPMPGAAVETMAAVPGASWMDDLDIRDDGSLWVTTNTGNTLLALLPTAGTADNGTAAGAVRAQFNAPIVALGAANASTVAGASSVAFGRGSVGRYTAFVVTGSGKEPAKVVAVDTAACRAQ
ncbi:hypothetical protein DHEL01_v212802 [Diaporthe helianthi]|uniref:SMP-30/Gluconolactonase/LRE-like region domain-containing protein n=1 Tax=Diaporthe helianthi TaxID=158607 RepID=A0A2P5HEX2_DIAHE|nr:hypothetical protein DHEL01_v212802 [Diaporthe helianthi]